jgi:hypothetical protein
MLQNSNAYEGVLLAAVFASRGYIVVVPNYADLPYFGVGELRGPGRLGPGRCECVRFVSGAARQERIV